MDNYINDMLSKLQGMPSNKYISAMIQQLNLQKLMENTFINDHTAQADDPNTGIKKGDFNLGGWRHPYDWTNPNIHLDPTDTNNVYNDQYYIAQIIGNMGPDGTPSNFNKAMDLDIDGIQRDYRVSALQELLAEYKDPIIAITIWIMTAWDDHFQSQQSGFEPYDRYLDDDDQFNCDKAINIGAKTLGIMLMVLQK